MNLLEWPLSRAVGSSTTFGSELNRLTWRYCRKTGVSWFLAAPLEHGGGAAPAERKADRPLQLEPNRPAKPAGPGVQPRTRAQQGAAEGPGCLHRPDRQEGKQARGPMLCCCLPERWSGQWELFGGWTRLCFILHPLAAPRVSIGRPTLVAEHCRSRSGGAVTRQPHPLLGDTADGSPGSR